MDDSPLILMLLPAEWFEERSMHRQSTFYLKLFYAFGYCSLILPEVIFNDFVDESLFSKLLFGTLS